MKRMMWLTTVVTVVVALVIGTHGTSAQAPDLAARLETLRAQANLPAVAGALFSSKGEPTIAAVGVRKLGDPTPVTDGDLWHIGSITKSFTSLLVATYVEAGELSWDATLDDLLGATRAGKFGSVTLAQLLSHRAGLPANATPVQVRTSATSGAPSGSGRQGLVDAVLAGDRVSDPGEAFLYSNLGYIVAGAALEVKIGKTWEELVQADVLDPLKLESAGFGPPGELNVLSQPRGHRAGPGGKLVAVEPGPFADNPPYLGPAGRLHMTVGDLARWGQVHLRGERGENGLVRAETFKRLHHPSGTETYAMGWLPQNAGGSQVFWHNGSNTMWYAIVAFSPDADRGVALITNGSISAAQALDAAAMAAIR